MSGSDVRHRLAHALGIQRGQLVFARDDRGHLWMAGRCRDCGAVSHKEVCCRMVGSAGDPVTPADDSFRLARF